MLFLYSLGVIPTCFLKAVGRIKNEALHEYALVGELALSGEVRRMCHGILPIVMEMKRIGKRAVIVPMENAEEASIVKGIDVLPVATLREAVDFLNGELNIAPCYTDLMEKVFASRDLGDDFADVKGQKNIKRRGNHEKESIIITPRCSNGYFYARWLWRWKRRCWSKRNILRI